MKTFWQNLSARDRHAIAAGGVVVAITLLWSLALSPLLQSRAALREEMAANAEALLWMRPAAERLGAHTTRSPSAVDRRPLLVRIDASVRSSGLGASVSGIEPVDPLRVRMQFSGADFDVLIQWLAQSSADGVRIEGFSAQRASGPGRVDARVSMVEDGL